MVYTAMPIASVGWLFAAIGCIWLQKWSRQ
jgi:hypothetical protein